MLATNEYSLIKVRIVNLSNTKHPYIAQKRPSVLFLAMNWFKKRMPPVPRFRWVPEEVIKSKFISNVVLTDDKDYHNLMFDFERNDPEALEYDMPAGVFRKGTVQNVGFRRSRGIYVGGVEILEEEERRKPQPKTRVIIDGLYSDCFRAPGVLVDSLASAFIKSLQLKGIGEFRTSGWGSGFICIQVDGGRLELDTLQEYSIVIQHADTAICAKANSIIVCNNVDFVNCLYAISADGLANPRQGSEYFNGAKGDSIVLVRNCRFWNCNTAVCAMEGATVYFERNNAFYGGKGRLVKEGGYIKKGDNLTNTFLDHINKIRLSSKWG
jgi:hypothetical protein